MTGHLHQGQQVIETGAEMMITSCPKCVAHFECLKFEGDPSYNFEILDVVSFLARQVDEKNALGQGASEVLQTSPSDEVVA